MELKTLFIQSDDGALLADATAHVYHADTTRLVDDLKGPADIPLTNPLKSDHEGLLQFSAPNGKYDIHIRKGNLEKTLKVQFFDIDDANSLSVSTSSGSQQLVEALDRRTLYVECVNALQELDTRRLLDGQTLYIKRFRQNREGGGGQFYWSANSTQAVDGGTVFGTKARPGRFIRLPAGAIYSDWFDLIDSVTEDQTEKFFSAKRAAEKYHLPLYLGDIRIVISRTCVIDSRSTSWIEGLSSQRGTTIIFRSQSATGSSAKQAFHYSETSSGSLLRNIQLVAETAGTSVGIAISSSLSAGIPNWKNRFDRVELRDFAIGAMTTTQNPFDGSTHGWASETLFFNCKFRNCRTSFLNNNLQAVNTTFIDTDMENDDSAERYTLIRDEAGGEIKVIGGSFIGRGTFYSWIYPDAARNLWYSGKVSFLSSRWEARSAPGERALCQEDHATQGDRSRMLTLNLSDVQINADGKDIDLLHYAGKLNARIENVVFSYGRGIIRQHPTSNLSGSATRGGMSSVYVTHSAGIHYQRARSTPYAGTHDENLTGVVSISSPHIETGGAYTIDGEGFFYPRNPACAELGAGLSLGVEEKTVTFGVAEAVMERHRLKMKLPTHARPTKFWAFKQPEAWQATTHRLYAVKDRDRWQDATFDADSDARLIAEIEAPPGAGYYEACVRLTSHDFGHQFQAGSDGWREGRLYVETTGSGFVGWVGIKYL
ncbi:MULTISPECIES: hypothetical protein [unclassified Modicisalibacter]|uniref:hypothetical protein n=1 Tax=unclassified Modicisalibacter TaxID=2679913 RepID=UPI001CCBCEDD|nr:MULTISPECIES: hypothetical protein [unclassified Modicisalibacter]MBZ9560020.1 hypothetical protein [Modicisalibacter sp. R2A 31.J]MBZ9575929.1 hypothetical protein [Modicisalibacter sp. MOD 31.J]